jgi:hypothetical protein
MSPTLMLIRQNRLGPSAAQAASRRSDDAPQN